MLKRAALFNEKLNKKIIEVIDDEHFKYWSGTWRDYDTLLDTNDYNRLQYVSVDKNEKILGYLSAGVDRELDAVTSIDAVNFTKEKNITFSKDFKEFLEMLFVKNKFRKITWLVLVGNTAEKMYDKIIEKYGGRIVGIEKEAAMTSYRELVDVKIYELFREDYLKAINV